MDEVTGRSLADCESVHGYVARVCFKNGPPGRVGAELEWLVASSSHPDAAIELRVLEDVLEEPAPMPGGSRISIEPGGQVELSSQVASDVTGCWRDLERDIVALDRRLGRRDLVRLATAIDPHRPPVRSLRSARYDAMQDYFDRAGHVGLVMMASTTALQVNLDAGRDLADISRRWALAHAIGPTMVAAFANSPVHGGRVTGWKSTRQRVWRALDPARTKPAHDVRLRGGSFVSAWAEYALDAPVMMVRRPGCWVSAPGFTFRQWVNGATGLGRPSEDDLAYHLTTLFPPVRPRGWFELRYLDAQPPHAWPVALAVVTALIEDALAGDRALEATEPVADRWDEAARVALGDARLARAASRCFEAALAALPRLGAEPALLDLVENFIERYVSRQRSPADDLLDSPVASTTPSRSPVDGAESGRP